MGAAVLLATVVVVMVGLPLAAVAWSRAEHARRPAQPSWADVLHAEARRHHLTAVQIEQVRQAVDRGREAPTELRAITAMAAAAKADWLVSVLRPPRRHRRSFYFAWAAVLVGGAAVAVLLSHKIAAAVMAIVVALLMGVVLRVWWSAQMKRARRAERLNGSVPDAGDADAVGQVNP